MKAITIRRGLGFGLAAVFALPSAAVSAYQGLPQAGEEWEIRSTYETKEEGSDGSSSSSSGHNTLLERVISSSAEGFELEYDLSKDATPDDRAREWKLPARVFRSTDGEFKLLNTAQLEARLESWLKSAKWDRAVCGRWIFTWNAFRIDCDPQSVLPIIKAYDLRRFAFRDGASIEVEGAKGSGILSRTDPESPSLSATMEVDPESVRRARAESAVAAGEILNGPVTLADALRERAKERIDGTIRITLESDASGNVIRLVQVTRTTVTLPDGRTETRTATETIARRRVSRP